MARPWRGLRREWAWAVGGGGGGTVICFQVRVRGAGWSRLSRLRICVLGSCAVRCTLCAVRCAALRSAAWQLAACGLRLRLCAGSELCGCGCGRPAGSAAHVAVLWSCDQTRFPCPCSRLLRSPLALTVHACTSHLPCSVEHATIFGMPASIVHSLVCTTAAGIPSP